MQAISIFSNMKVYKCILNSCYVYVCKYLPKNERVTLNILFVQDILYKIIINLITTI